MDVKTKEEIKEIIVEVIKDVVLPAFETVALKSDIESLDKRMDGFDSRMDRFEQKQDAQTADIIQLQAEVGAIGDKLDSVDEKLTKHIQEDRVDHDEIREFVGMTPAIRNNS